MAFVVGTTYEWIDGLDREIDKQTDGQMDRLHIVLIGAHFLLILFKDYVPCLQSKLCFLN